MIYFVTPRDHEFGIGDYLVSWGRGLAAFVSVLHYEDLPERTTVPAGTYIFLGLDQLTPGGTGLVCELQDQLRTAPRPAPVLNDPRSILLRFELLFELHRQGLNRHRAIRAGADRGGLRFPVFLREESRHSGSLSPLLHSPAEVDKAMGRAVLKGYRLEELLLVEFCDTADAQGRYRKYTTYAVGSAIIPRGMGRGRDWMLKAEGVEFSEEMLLEERAYALSNPYEGQLRRIFELAGTGFGRIDFAVKDGMVETWEINLNPTIGPGRSLVTPEWAVALRQPARDLFSRRFQAALEALDTSQSTEPLAVAYSAACRRGASPMVRPPPRDGWLVQLARAAHPLRPLFDQAARIAAPAVARLARWFR